MDQPSQNAVEAPPTTVFGILRRLGPGLIIAGSIVGSGELIATTKTGAQAGFWLLWLIIIGCLIKVFAQVEFGRYAISSGKATMSAMDEVPGPRLRVNWIMWYWLVMFIVSLAQLGGIVQGVGQSLAMSVPIDGSFNRLLEDQDAWDEEAGPIEKELRANEAQDLASDEWAVRDAAEKRVEAGLIRQMGGPRPGYDTPGFFWTDDIQWAIAIGLVTAVILVVGRYGLIQSVSTVMVAAFTAVTLFTVVAMQTQPEWAVTASDLKDGLSFQLPPVVKELTKSPLATALATFGIIGVGANELITYPYWCLEKGYARFTGPRDESPEWAERARGWMRVMRWDACVSMVVYTFATVAFYLLGAAVLHRKELDPAEAQMVPTLAQMYVPVFGSAAKWLFLFGAFAVLYSTFFVANAGHARVASDAVRVFRAGARTESARLWWVRTFCILLPLVALAFCIFLRKPAELIMASGVMQAIMLPMLGGATLYYRYRRCDRRIMPGRAWDLMLWISAIGLLVAGGSIALMKLFPGLQRLGM
ncbi:MAG: Nramp family divalent metal transporter [Planctomycetota bacterium]|jgi:Mn2+/Fe2+ NRAMP family transporter